MVLGLRYPARLLGCPITHGMCHDPHAHHPKCSEAQDRRAYWAVPILSPALGLRRVVFALAALPAALPHATMRRITERGAVALSSTCGLDARLPLVRSRWQQRQVTAHSSQPLPWRRGHAALRAAPCCATTLAAAGRPPPS